MQLTISPRKKEFLNTFLLTLAYAAAFYGLQFFLFSSSMVAVRPSNENIIFWDGGWYYSIAHGGYQYHAGGQSNLAFFILFPLIWKISHLGVWGISLLNIVFFAAGFSILCDLLKPSTQNKILWLSFPSIFFVFIPYSEALFFLLLSATLYGVVKQNRWIIWGSLFLLSLTRATGIFLAPAFLAMVLLSDERKNWYKNLFSYFITYLLPMIVGTAVFIWYEYLKSGIWFVFFDIEADESWGHKFNWPIMPFSSVSGPPLLWISALVLFAGFFCLFYLVFAFFKWLIKNHKHDKLLIAACGYLFMSFLETILFNPTWGSGTTNILSIFRYGTVNPLFFVFLYHFSTIARYTWKHYLLVFVLCNVLWLSFGSYLSVADFFYFNTNTIIVFVYMLFSNKKLQWPVLLLTALNVYFQIYYFQHFIAKYFTE